MSRAPEVPGLAEALPELESTLEVDRSPRNLMRVAEAFRLVGRSDRAIELLEPLVESEPARISPRVLLAWCFEDEGRALDAEDMLAGVQSLDPGNPFVKGPEPAHQPVPFDGSQFAEREGLADDVLSAAAEVPAQGDPADPAEADPAEVEPSDPEASGPEAPELDDSEKTVSTIVDGPATAEGPVGEPAARAEAESDLSEWEAEPERALTLDELGSIPPGPLYSATLASIFERQGFEGKAIEIYEALLRTHPERMDLRERILTLQSRAQEDASR